MSRFLEVISMFILPVSFTALALATMLTMPPRSQALVLDNGSFTYDPRTGLSWLDLTQTFDISYDQMQVMLRPGGPFDGFRQASQDEVLQLFRDAGIMNVPFFQSSLSQFQLAPIRELQSLVGVTNTIANSSFVRSVSTGISSTLLSGSSLATLPFIEVVDRDGDDFDLGSASISSLERTGTSPAVGHWLISTDSVAGRSSAVPILPTSSDGTTFSFTDQDGSGLWFDPIAADGFTYSVTDGVSNFTMVGLPEGSGDTDGLFMVTDAANGVREAAAGDFVEFATPVDTFTITGIDPRVDGADQAAFPTFLIFDQALVSFIMTPIGILVETTTTTSTTTTSSTTTTTVAPTTTSLLVTTTTSSTSSTLPAGIECGDANRDGRVSTSDALIALRAAVELVHCPLALCDATGNGVITADDALRILQRAVGLDVAVLCSVGS